MELSRGRFFRIAPTSLSFYTKFYILWATYNAIK
jgi:hypothetical protein